MNIKTCMSHKGVSEKFTEIDERNEFCKKFAEKQVEKILINFCMDDTKTQSKFTDIEERLSFCKFKVEQDVLRQYKK